MRVFGWGEEECLLNGGVDLVSCIMCTGLVVCGWFTSVGLLYIILHTSVSYTLECV
jgi:hypothetical protein